MRKKLFSVLLVLSLVAQNMGGALPVYAAVFHEGSEVARENAADEETVTDLNGISANKAEEGSLSGDSVSALGISLATGKTGVRLSYAGSPLKGYRLLFSRYGNMLTRAEGDGNDYSTDFSIAESETEGLYLTDYSNLSAYTGTYGYIYLYEAGQTDSKKYVGIFQCKAEKTDGYLYFADASAEDYVLNTVDFQMESDFDCIYVPDQQFYLSNTLLDQPREFAFRNGYASIGTYQFDGWTTHAQEGKPAKLLGDSSAISENYIVYPKFANIQDVETTTEIKTAEEFKTLAGSSAGNSYLLLKNNLTITQADLDTQYQFSVKKSIVVPNGVTLTVSGAQLSGDSSGKDVDLIVQKGGSLALTNEAQIYGLRFLAIQNGATVNINHSNLLTDNFENHGTVIIDSEFVSDYGDCGASVRTNNFFNSRDALLDIRNGEFYISNDKEKFNIKKSEDQLEYESLNYNNGTITLTGYGQFYQDGLIPLEVGGINAKFNYPFINAGTINIGSEIAQGRNDNSTGSFPFSLQYYSKMINRGTINVTGDFYDKSQPATMPSGVYSFYGIEVMGSILENQGQINIETKKGNGIYVFSEGVGNNPTAQFNNKKNGTIKIVSDKDKIGFYVGKNGTLNNEGTINASSKSTQEIDNTPIVIANHVNNTGSITNTGYTGFFCESKGDARSLSGNAIEGSGKKAFAYDLYMQGKDNNLYVLTTYTMDGIVRNTAYSSQYTCFLPEGVTKAFTAAASGYTTYHGSIKADSSLEDYRSKVTSFYDRRHMYKFEGSGNENPTDKVPTCKITQTQPMNLFYQASAPEGKGVFDLSVPGQTITNVTLGNGSSPYFTLDYSGGKITVTPDSSIPLKENGQINETGLNKKLVLQIYLEGYAKKYITKEIKLTTVNKGPSYVLMPSEVAVYPGWGIQSGLLNVYDKAEKEVVSNLDGFESYGVKVVKNKEVSAEFNEDNSAIKVTISKNGVGAFSLQVKEDDYRAPLVLAGKIKILMPKATLATKTILFNREYLSENREAIHIDMPLNLDGVSINKITVSGMNVASQAKLDAKNILLTYNAETGYLQAEAKGTQESLPSGTYQYKITPSIFTGGAIHDISAQKLTIRVVDKNAKMILKGKNKIDLLDREAVANSTYTVALQNISGTVSSAVIEGEYADKFETPVVNGGKIVLKAKENASFKNNTTYVLNLKVKLDNGMSMDGVVKLKTAQSPVALTASDKKIKLNLSETGIAYGKGLTIGINTKNKNVEFDEKSVIMVAQAGFAYDLSEKKIYISDAGTLSKGKTYTLTFCGTCLGAGENTAAMTTKVKVTIQ